MRISGDCQETVPDTFFIHVATQRSCRAAVARVAVLWLGMGRQVSSTNTGAYCRARTQLSETAIARLTRAGGTSV